MALLFQQQPRTYRAPKNPLDKATIVSVFPKPIKEIKHTISPNTFIIPAAPPDGFSLLTVSPASWWRYTDIKQPYLEIPESAVVLAESIIKDYCSGMLGVDMGARMPGLFFIPGDFDQKTVLLYSEPGEKGKSFKTLLKEAKEKQHNWFRELVKIADINWARTNGNPISIPEDAKMAAKALNLDKPWIRDFQISEMVNCQACGHVCNPLYPICSNCRHVINKARAIELGIIETKVG